MKVIEWDNGGATRWQWW